MENLRPNKNERKESNIIINCGKNKGTVRSIMNSERTHECAECCAAALRLSAAA
jgi:hypothetical protein